MANIKFSQFTVGNTESDIDFVVGYKGANNIQISPANLLSATLTGYLPLTGGTMTGDVKFNDNVRSEFGNAGDLEIYHNGTNNLIDSINGDISIRQLANDKDIRFRCDDGSGGETDYFILDGSATNMKVYKDMRFLNNIDAQFGTNGDFKIYHDGSNQYLDMINSGNGNIIIQNQVDDASIIFKCDDGSGGLDTYFSIVGAGNRVQYNKNLRLIDNAKATFGSSDDLQIYHDGTNSRIYNDIGDLYIRNNADDKDIYFQSDNGSGGVATYFYLDGSLTTVSPRTVFPDDSVLGFGTGADLQIYHDGTTSNIANYTNNLSIINHFNDGDIKFFSDDGSGGVTEYFRLDGGTEEIIVSKKMQFNDNVKAVFGTGEDLDIFHDGTDSTIDNAVGDLIISNNADDKDIIFKSDNGSGGIATYFYLDGSATLINVSAANGMQFNDNVRIKVGSGSGGDLRIYHDTSNSYIENNTNDLIILNNANDKDIVFQCDDGAGGVTTYFRLDGSIAGFTTFPDGTTLAVGTDRDFRITHDGTTTNIFGVTGDMVFTNFADDKDITFRSDDGSGGITEYFKLDGSDERLTVNAPNGMLFFDNIKAKFGTGSDLQIYHDGSDSIIKDDGTGSLDILSSHVHIKSSGGTNNMAQFFSGGNSYIYANNVLRIEATTSGAKVHGGLNITGVSEYADNTAAIAGGLTTGDVYRTGDLLKIVH